MIYSYFIPLIHIGPIAGYEYVQSLPLERIAQIIIGNYIKIEVTREVIFEGKLHNKSTEVLEYDNGIWKNEKVRDFNWKSPNNERKFCFIETHINIIEGKGLKTHFIPSFYVQYLSTTYKSFLSCGNYKYGDPRLIYQIEEFEKWIDGYPAINIDRKLNTTYSVVIVNPYNGNTNLLIEIPDLQIQKQIKVKGNSTETLFLDKLICKDQWTGQIFIHGERRCINYLVNHELDNINNIITIEHTDPYRAEPSMQARFLLFRIKAHKVLKKYKSIFLKSKKIIRS